MELLYQIIFSAGGLIAVLALVALYRKYPLHLIYRSKIGLEDMLDGVSDPLAVITEDYTVKRANKAYISMISSNFQDTINKKCYTLLRNRTSPCEDCLMKQSFSSGQPATIELSKHPSGSGAISISFSTFDLTMGKKKTRCIIEHIRDITLLEQLKLDLEKKNASLARAMKHLKAAQANIRDELRLARTIQQGILPKHAPDVDGLKISVVYHPVTEVGGDIYDFIKFSPEHMGIFIGDASGHGLSAAFVGTISKMSLYNNSKKEMPVNELLSKVNQDMIDNVHTGHYLTCFWGIFDTRSKKFTYSRAGHPIPVLVKRNGTVIPLKSQGTFLGLLPNSMYEEQSIEYEKGDRFFLFTDGIFEVLDPESKGEMLGYDRFVKILAGCNHLPFNKVLQSIQQQLSSFTYEDDYTLILIEATARKSEQKHRNSGAGE
jgi:serine phosphatase RsbU (regulator of sigma subunit)